MIRALIAASALSVFTACTEADFNNRPLDSGSLSDTSSVADDSGAADSADVEPAWYRLSAQLNLAQSALQGGTVSFAIYGEDLDLGVVCEVSRALELVEAREQTPDPLIYHWWRLSLADPEEEPCAGGLPDVLMLGLGGLHSELEPGIDRDGYGDVRSSLYGAYLNVQVVRDNQDIDANAFLLGYAATEAGYAGETLAVDAAPIPDGSYRVHGVFLQGL